MSVWGFYGSLVGGKKRRREDDIYLFYLCEILVIYFEGREGNGEVICREVKVKVKEVRVRGDFREKIDNVYMLVKAKRDLLKMKIN